MKNSLNALMLFFGFLGNADILATESIFDGKLDEISARVPLHQHLICALENERRLEDKLSKRTTQLVVEYREVFLFQSTRQIMEILTSPDHPYKINTHQLFQCRQRIDELQKQLLNFGYLEEYVLIRYSFPKPNIHRFDGHFFYKEPLA